MTGPQFCTRQNRVVAVWVDRPLWAGPIVEVTPVSVTPVSVTPLGIRPAFHAQASNTNRFNTTTPTISSEDRRPPDTNSTPLSKSSTLCQATFFQEQVSWKTGLAFVEAFVPRGGFRGAFAPR